MEPRERDVLITQDTKIAQQILGQILGQNKNSGSGIIININTIGHIGIGMDKSDQRAIKFIHPNEEPTRKIFNPKSPSGKLLTDGRIKNPQNGKSKDEIIKILNDNGWKRPETAKALGITVNALYMRIRRFGITPPSGSWP